MSHTYNFTLLSSTFIVFILKSIPIFILVCLIITDGRHVRHGEVVFRKSEQDAGLADTGVTNDDQLEEVIIARLFL